MFVSSALRAIKALDRRVGRLRIAVVGVMAFGAVPASAAMVIQNFMSANVVRAAPCLVKVPGLDPASYPSGPTAFPGFSVVNTTTALVGGVPLLQETITVNGTKGDRIISADTMRIRNRCGYNLSIQLIAENQAGGSAVSGSWTDASIRVYLGKSTVAAPATDALPPATGGSVLAAGNSFGDPLVVSQWDQTPLSVLASASGTLTGSATGTVVLNAGRDLQVGYLIDAGSTSLASLPVLRYTVKASVI
jgi:hypothetical protein